MKYMNNSYGNSRIFGRARCKAMPLDLQFFAEGGEGSGAGGSGDGAGAAGGEGGDPGAGGTGGAGGEGDQGAGSGTLSFDDFLKKPEYQSEFDKRVAKALETQKGKMQQDIQTQIENARTEAEKMAKMNADQKAQYEREKKEKEISDREREITKRELTATAKEQLAEKGLPISLASILNYENAETCSASIESVAKAFQEAVEKGVNDRLAGGKPPKKPEGGSNTIFTREQIQAMSPSEINANWDAVQNSMKLFK